MKIAFVRGAYMNNYEAQNYRFSDPSIQITGFSSLYPIHTHLPFPLVRLPSIIDLGRNSAALHFPFLQNVIRYTANRLIGGPQLLWGLEQSVEGYDIVHTADPHYYFSYQLAQMRKSNRIRQLLITGWETIPGNNESVGVKRYRKYEVLKTADYALVYSNAARNALIADGFPKEKCIVVRLGVDLDRFYPAKNESEVPLKILFVGRLVPEKGVRELIEGFSTYVGITKRKSILQIVGSGPLARTLKKLIQKKGIEKMVYFSTASYEQMPEIYRSAHIFIAPSLETETWEEQYGMVLVEAMASGLPVITTRSGAILEVGGDAVIYLPDTSAEQISDTLQTVSQNKHLRKTYGQKAYVRAKNLFNARTSARAIGTIYRRL